jgi:hypothetical protein
MAEYYAERVKIKARYDIPVSLAREIGRFLVTWAYFEHYVQAVIWTALKLGEEEGRLTVREPRVTERLDMIRDLGEFQNLEMDYVLLQEIRKKADPLAGKRHLLAHTIWAKIDNEWSPLQTRGSWQEMQIEILNYHNRPMAQQLHEFAHVGDDCSEVGEENALAVHRPSAVRSRRLEEKPGVAISDAGYRDALLQGVGQRLLDAG